MYSTIERLKSIKTLTSNELSKDCSSIIFFVTSKCNQACGFCFYSNNINNNSDLSFNEILDLSAKIGNIRNLLLSGGEPVLRKDIVDIVGIFIKNNNIKHVTMPSNGMSKELLCNTAEDIVIKFPAVSLQVCISLDGPRNLHDEIRGVHGAFDKALQSIRALFLLAEKYDNMSLNINTVISNKNIHSVNSIIDNLRTLNIKNYTHSFEIVRPSSIISPEVPFIDRRILKNAYKDILRYKDILFLDRMEKGTIAKTMMGAMHYANIYSLYKIQYDYFTKRKRWPMKCCAGRDDNVVFNNGDVSICELRDSIFNIRSISDGEEYIRRIKGEQNKNKDCCCTHICYILLSMYKSKKMILVVFPLRVIRYLLVKIGILSYF